MNIGDYYTEADPINLARAIVFVHERWKSEGIKPGREELVVSSRLWRPKLVKEIEDEWYRLNGLAASDDVFPYHESYVVRKWIQFRKMNEETKGAWFRALMEDQ